MDDSCEDVILKRLEEYGDSVVGEPLKKKKKKGYNDRPSSIKTDKPKQNNTSDVTDASKNPDTQCMSKSKRKRLKKKLKKLLVGDKSGPNNKSLVTTNTAVTAMKQSGDLNKDTETVDTDSDWGDEFDESDGNGEVGDNETASVKGGSSKQLQLLSKELGLEEFKHQVEEERLDVQEQEKLGKQPEVVVFKSHRRKEKVKLDKGKNQSSKTEGQADVVEFNLNKARYEVQKYGIKGFHGDQKEEAMTAMLIKLGAKPPKNKYKNYKDFQEERKKALQLERENKEKDRNSGLKVKKSGDHGRKRVRDKNDVGELDGQAGKWKKGVQVIKKADLIGFQASKLKT